MIPLLSGEAGAKNHGTGAAVHKPISAARIISYNSIRFRASEIYLDVVFRLHDAH